MQAYQFPHQVGFYSGKVRDVYYLENNWLVMIASDRISAFDVILPAAIPHKGQVLNQIAAYMLEATAHICPNWLVRIPAANAAIGRQCVPYKVEMVIRGNLTGHAWRTYQSGLRTLCGVSLPEGMQENDYFPAPIITPSTKAAVGHDEDISKADIIRQHIVGEADYAMLENHTRALFDCGREIAAKQDLILADTKYEFGRFGDTIYLMDEIHTPDSSRYFYADGFEERQRAGQRQQQLSKEFVREWLIENNFMGKPGQQVPAMSEAWVHTISGRYTELYEKLTGQAFVPETLTESAVFDRIVAALKECLNPD